VLYCANKRQLIFLIYYKFANALSYGEPVMGVTKAKPWVECSVVRYLRAELIECRIKWNTRQY